MIAWRLCDRRWGASAFSGEDARRLGGRWNSPGTAVVYTADSQSLALLEQLVHFDIDTTPPSFVAISVEISDDLIARVDAVPPSWPDSGPGVMTWTVAFGNQWLVERRSVALSVPSAVVPDERNVLLNPNHPEVHRIDIGLPRDFRFDGRLLRASRR